jgi:hypothetical protein
MERIESPHSAIARPIIEPIWHPLFSACRLASGTAPVETLLYNYPIGGTVSGTGGTATRLHTNMEQANVLGTPKVFEIHGIRLVLSQINGTADAYTTPLENEGMATGTALGGFITGASNIPLVSDAMRIIYASYYNLFIGAKSYLDVPAFMLPGNTGIEGDFASALTTLGEPNSVASALFHSESLAHTVGMYYSIRRHPIQIPPQQSFFAAIRFPLPTRPTLDSDRVVWSVWDGSLGREVQ